jgi:hypothetical protein
MKHLMKCHCKAEAAATILLLTMGAMVFQPSDAQAATPSAGSAVVPHGSRARPSWPQGHLYVIDTTAATVDRFPLAADGMPSEEPDSSFVISNPGLPEGLAVDRSGNVFVADEVAGAVNEYAAGATGLQAPVATLNLLNDAPNVLKMDEKERLYVHYGGGVQNESIAIFAKGATGNDQPMSVVPPYTNPPGLASDFVIPRSGKLYVLYFGGPIAVYNDPLNDPVQPDTFMWRQSMWEFDFVFSLALDQAEQRLYMGFVSRSEYRWNTDNWGVRSLIPSGGALDPLIYNGQCGKVLGDDRIYETVIVQKYLIASCLTDHDILVLRKDRFGMQNAVKVIGRKLLLGPSQIAVGP